MDVPHMNKALILRGMKQYARKKNIRPLGLIPPGAGARNFVEIRKDVSLRRPQQGT